MTWTKLLANNNVTRQPATKKELANLRSIVSRSLKDVNAPGLSADARFIMAYDAGRTLSLMIVRASGYRPKAAAGHYNTFLALETADRRFAKLSHGSHRDDRHKVKRRPDTGRQLRRPENVGPAQIDFIRF